MTETNQVYCSRLSDQAGEPLFASATPTHVYLLLQYQAEWESKALEESSLPGTVIERLKRFSKSHPEVKVLLIRKGERDIHKHTTVTNAGPELHGESGALFYVAQVVESAQRLYRFELENYQDLLEIGLETFLSGGEIYADRRSDEQLLLVCTNGRRDLCCNKFGTPVFRELASAVGEFPGLQAWQSTHMGGHRFAANVLWLPQGVLYGRVDPLSARAILVAGLKRQVYLPNLRGRTAYPEEVQAADYYLRIRNKESSLDAYRLREVRALGEDRWQVNFTSAFSDEQQLVELYLETDDSVVFDSCMLDKTTRVKNYRLAA